MTRLDPQAFSDCSVALLVEDRRGDIEVGSAICVRVGRAFLLATAGHNLRGVASLGQVRAISRGRYRADPLRPVAAGTARSAGEADVAWLELRAEAVERPGLAAVEVATIEADPRPGSGRADRRENTLWIHGYPSAGLDPRRLRATHFRLPAADLESRRVRPEPGTVGFRRETDLAVTWPAGGGPSHPRGLSGGGVFVRARGPAVRLLALTRAYNRVRGLLFCTRIEHWLTRVRCDRPELARHLCRRRSVATGER